MARQIEVPEDVALTLLYELTQHVRRRLQDPAIKAELDRSVGEDRSSEVLAKLSRASEVLFPGIFLDFLADNVELLNVAELKIWSEKRRVMDDSRGSVM